MDPVRALHRLFGVRFAPVGRVRVVDPSPLNWLSITYNTAEELVRVSPAGKVVPAAMKSFRWVDSTTLEVDVRKGNRFPDGTLLDASIVKRSLDEVLRWDAPHPPGTHFNHPKGTTCEVVSDFRVRIKLPVPDGLTVGKLRAAHLMTERFWNEVGFGYAKHESGEGRW